MRGLDGVKDCFSLRSDGFCNEDYILMQFTGLTDKNGVEIFEFDYVMDEFKQRILVEHDFTLLSRLKEIQNKILLDGNFYE
jgi:uncharacterized phage protein (TIGR01671 family)